MYGTGKPKTTGRSPRRAPLRQCPIAAMPFCTAIGRALVGGRCGSSLDADHRKGVQTVRRLRATGTGSSLCNDDSALAISNRVSRPVDGVRRRFAAPLPTLFVNGASASLSKPPTEGGYLWRNAACRNAHFHRRLGDGVSGRSDMSRVQLADPALLDQRGAFGAGRRRARPHNDRLVDVPIIGSVVACAPQSCWRCCVNDRRLAFLSGTILRGRTVCGREHMRITFGQKPA
jgi:hypothetical protein